MLSTIYSPMKREEGFTLIELLVVIIIIGILAAIAIPLFLDQRKLAVDASVKSDVRNTLANIKTWQANDANANKAVANTGEFTNTTNNGKVAQSPGNSIGISISSTGDATVCGYNNSGKTYLSDSASYLFSPATGQFTTGSCATGSTTGGVAATGSGSGGSSVPVGGVVNGTYTATLETNDSTNSMWTDYNTTTSVYSTYVSSTRSHNGSKSITMPWNANCGYGCGTQQGRSFKASPALTSGKTYTVTAWVYIDSATTTNDQVAMAATSGSTNGAGYVTATKNGWTQLTTEYTPNASNGYIYFYIIAFAGTSGGTVYVDDLVISPKN